MAELSCGNTIFRCAIYNDRIGTQHSDSTRKLLSLAPCPMATTTTKPAMPIAIPAMLNIACRGLIFHISKAGRIYLKKSRLIIGPCQPELRPASGRSCLLLSPLRYRALSGLLSDPSVFNCLSRLTISAELLLSRLPVGSSASNSRGRLNRARAMATR